MRDLSFYSVIAVNTAILVRYTVLTVKKRIEPSLAMWIFFSIAVVGSLFSYLLDGDFSPLDNILNTSDIVLCLTLSAVIYIYGGREARFNSFEKLCLALVGLILTYWYFSKAHFTTNLSLQLIQFIAYLPVYNRMWKAGRNTESFMTWILLFLVSVISLFDAKGTLALIYSIRATACTAVLLLLMVRLEIKKNRPKPVPETKNGG
ncbi:MAG: hypothetical protein JXR86_19970 [Spirochaetales bacterium]|nr:hypothetical protein [Spirochaetales bacterium]